MKKEHQAELDKGKSSALTEASSDKAKIAELEAKHTEKDKEIEAHKKDLALHKDELEKLQNRHDTHVSKTDTVIKNRVAESENIQKL